MQGDDVNLFEKRNHVNHLINAGMNKSINTSFS
jgi:hypothetical protein